MLNASLPQTPLPPKPRGAEANLLSDKELPKDLVYGEKPKAAGLFKLATIAIPLAFLLLKFSGDYLATQNTESKAKIQRLEAQVGSLRQTEAQAVDLIAKITLHKKILSSRVPAGENLKFIVDSVDASIALLRVTSTQTDFEIEISTASPIAAALLINRILANDKVTYIVIKSVQLDSTTDAYTSVLEIQFK